MTANGVFEEELVFEGWSGKDSVLTLHLSRELPERYEEESFVDD